MMRAMIQDLLVLAQRQRKENRLEEARGTLLEAVSGAQELLAHALTALG